MAIAPTKYGGRAEEAKAFGRLIKKALKVSPVSVDVLGSNVIVTVRGEATAKRVANLFANTGEYTVSMWESIEENIINTGRMLRPDSHKVWRVGAKVR